MVVDWRKTGSRKVTLGLLERHFDMGNQISPVPDPDPELAISMLNFFKKYTLNLESYDVDTLPGELKEFFKHPMIDSILNQFREEIVQGIKEKVIPVLKQFELMGTVRGPIQVYFPVKDTFVFKVEENVFNRINQPSDFLINYWLIWSSIDKFVIRLVLFLCGLDIDNINNAW